MHPHLKKNNTTNLVEILQQTKLPELSPNSPEELKTRHHNHWAGWTDIKWKPLIEYQIWASKIRSKNPLMANIEYHTHCEPLLPFVTEFYEYVETRMKHNQKYNHLQFFLDEINNHIKENQLTPIWYFNLPLRFQASIISEDDSIKKTGDKDEKLYQKDIWKNTSNLLLDLENIKITQHKIEIDSKNLTINVNDIVRQQLPAIFILPALKVDEGFLGLKTLIHTFPCFLYLIGIFQKPSQIDGFLEDILEATQHDYDHISDDFNDKNIAISFARNILKKLMNEHPTISYTKLLKISCNYSVKRYMHFVKMMHEIITTLDEKNILNEKALNGLFNIRHEENLQNLNILDQPSFKKIIQNFRTKKAEKIRECFVANNTEILLMQKQREAFLNHSKENISDKNFDFIKKTLLDKLEHSIDRNKFNILQNLQYLIEYPDFSEEINTLVTKFTGNYQFKKIAISIAQKIVIFDELIEKTFRKLELEFQKLVFKHISEEKEKEYDLAIKNMESDFIQKPIKLEIKNIHIN